MTVRQGADPQLPLAVITPAEHTAVCPQGAGGDVACDHRSRIGQSGDLDRCQSIGSRVVPNLPGAVESPADDKTVGPHGTPMTATDGDRGCGGQA